METKINSKIWSAVRKNFEARNFSEAILDGIHYLSNLLREKTGLESDGQSLVGQAFGGNQPLIKVNSLQTDSEINIQKGLEQILRGIYQAIRNPRSHDRLEDTEKEAEAIIIFIDYLCGIIDHSKTNFSEVDFLNRVFDVNFVESDKYAELLLNEIPKRKRLSFAIEVYRKKETGDSSKLSYFIKAIVGEFSEEELNQFYEVVSEEFIIVIDEKTIRYALHIIPIEDWNKIREVARIRIENILMKSIREGRFIKENNKTNGGALGTWVGWNKLRHMTFVKDFQKILVKKLNSEDDREIDYVFKYFWDELTVILGDKIEAYFETVVKKKLKSGDKRFYDNVSNEMVFGEFNEVWNEVFTSEIDGFEEKQTTSDLIDISDDDLPF